MNSKRITVKKIIKFIFFLLMAIIATILSAYAIGRAVNNMTPKGGINESINRNAERLRTNYKMIKLDNTVSLPFTLDELVYEYSGITTNEVLNGIGLR